MWSKFSRNIIIITGIFMGTPVLFQSSCPFLSMKTSAHLIGPADEVQVVPVEELGDHLGAEGEGHSAVVLAPALRVLGID